MQHLLARQMLGQRPAGRLLRLDCGSRRSPPPRPARRSASRSAWSVSKRLDRQLELLDLARQLLRRAAELGPPVARQLELQLGDLGLRRHRVARHLGDDALQRGDVVGQGCRARSSRRPIGSRSPAAWRCLNHRLSQSVAAGLSRPAPAGQVRTRHAASRSPPAASTVAPASAPPRPASARGHTNRPRSSRLANRHSPSPSHHNSLIRSPRRPRKQNTWPENGSLPSTALRLRRQAVEPLAHVGRARRQPHPRARRQTDHRSSSITCRSVSGDTSPRTHTRAPQAKVISIDAAAPRPRRVDGSLALRHDLHRQHGDASLRRRRLLRRHLPPPFEQLVGVHVMAPRHDRNRRARLQRLGHDLTLQRLGPLPTLRPARLSLSVH